MLRMLTAIYKHDPHTTQAVIPHMLNDDVDTILKGVYLSMQGALAQHSYRIAPRMESPSLIAQKTLAMFQPTDDRINEQLLADLILTSEHTGVDNGVTHLLPTIEGGMMIVAYCLSDSNDFEVSANDLIVEVATFLGL